VNSDDLLINLEAHRAEANRKQRAIADQNINMRNALLVLTQDLSAVKFLEVVQKLEDQKPLLITTPSPPEEEHCWDAGERSPDTSDNSLFL
jgi:hypothetical protein